MQDTLMQELADELSAAVNALIERSKKQLQ